MTHPEERASFLSKLTFSWANPLINLARGRQIVAEDVWDSPSQEKVQVYTTFFWQAWHKELEKAKLEKRPAELLKALYYSEFGRRFMIAGCYQFMFMSAQIAQPFLVSQLVYFIANNSHDVGYGVGLALGLFAVSMVSSSCLTMCFNQARRNGVALRCAIMMVVYEHSLCLTATARLQNTVGQITNLMAIDAEKVFLSINFMHFVWHGPLASIIIMCLLIRTVGVGPALVGLGSQLALIPLQNHLAAVSGRIRRDMVKDTDERVKLTNELLQSIRVVKLYAWESPMEKRILSVRAKELRRLNVYLHCNAILRELIFAAGPIAVAVIIASFVYWFGQPLTVPQIFEITAFVNILRLPTNLLGQALKQMSDGLVSLSRLNRFLLLPTIPETEKKSSEINEVASIHIDNASFRWDLPDSTTTKDSSSISASTKDHLNKSVHQAFALHNLTLISRHPTELIGLIGQVGSGKSSLMAALLKEMPLLSGTCGITGNVAYCTQTPWIQNISLRDNVLFGLKYEDPGVAEAYECAIDAAALRPDIAILPGGDMTEIGEKGINLSGGQKARVSIARAILAATANHAQVVLLDDPFSAVDGSTGNWIFEHGILQSLKHTLRVIALNSHRQLLHRFDRVIILEHGTVVADGHPSELAVTHRDMLFGSSLGVSSKEEIIKGESSAQRSPTLLRRQVPAVPVSSSVPKFSTADENKSRSTDLALASSSSTRTNTRSIGDVKVMLAPTDTGKGDVNGVGGGGRDLPAPPYDESKALEGLLENMNAGGTKGGKMVINATANTITSTGATHTMTKTPGSTSDEPSGGDYVPLPTPVGSTIDRSSDDRNQDLPNSNSNNNNNNRRNPSHRTTRINRVVKQLVVTETRKAGDVSLAVFSKYFAAAMNTDITKSSSSVMYTMDSEAVETAKRKKAKIEEAAAKSTATSAEKRAQAMPQDLKSRINGWLIAFGLFLLFTTSQVSRVAIDYSLAKWASIDAGDPKSPWALTYWICIPVLIGFLCLRSVYLNIFAYLSAKQIHGAVFRAVLCAPITTFFDTHTVGMVLNRFAKDTEIVDSTVPEFLLQFLTGWTQILSIFALCLWSTPYFVIVMVPMIIMFARLFRQFANIQQDLKRLESVSRSPLFSALSETLVGLETIRAYNASERFLASHRVRMDFNHKFFYTFWMCTSWVTARLEAATSFVLLAIAILAVNLGDVVSPVTLGLALSYSLMLTALFQRVVQVSIDMAVYMTSTERVMEYLEIDPEPNVITSSPNRDNNDSNNSVSGGVKMSPAWPASGVVEFRNVWMKYRDNPPVLRGISFLSRAGERIGICGRTGAGKSSLMTALFRVAPLDGGQILLDGIDCARVPLQQLRSALAIIPQDPVLFTGNIRFQLDPFAQYPDSALWAALDQVSMADFVRASQGKLEEIVLEGGENLSQGQRQLLCIARALIRKARVLVMDEGTSAVDPQTDDLIQKVLRGSANREGTTVLTIAHRLDTIIDFDRILVLGQGEVLEFDAPQSLLSNPDSVFSGMMRDQDRIHTPRDNLENDIINDEKGHSSHNNDGELHIKRTI